MPLSAMTTALAGMNAASRRLDVSATNVANMRTTGPVPDQDGATTAYRPLSVRQSDTGSGPTTDVVPRTPAFELQMDPNDPHADERGMVAGPAVDLTTELTDQLQAAIVYKANAATMKVAARMASTLLDSDV